MDFKDFDEDVFEKPCPRCGKALEFHYAYCTDSECCGDMHAARCTARDCMFEDETYDPEELVKKYGTLHADPT